MLLRTRASLMLFAMLIAVTTLPAVAGTVSYGGQIVGVQVNDLVCTTFPVQCTDLGAPSEAPEDGNNSAVMLVVEVLDRGDNPVTGLLEADFNMAEVITPAGGTVPELVSCPSCFVDLGNGLYTLWLQPTLAGVWLDGSYIGRLEVDLGSRVARNLFRVDVPPSP